MFKLIALCVVLVACVSAAPLSGGEGGGFRGRINGPGGAVSAEAKIKGLKAVLYLFAPTSWIDAWNAISADGQECFVNTASDPANKDLYSSDDTAKIKEDLQNKCPAASAQIGAFIDATEQTYKSLPASFVADIKSWGQQIQSLGQQAGTAAAGAAPSSTAVKERISQFASITATFTGQLAALPESERQQISAAFPKLTAFISGDHAVEFLNQLTALYKTIGAGNVDPAALKTQAQQLKTTLQAVWQQYAAQNAEGLQEAGKLLGKDLTQADKFFQQKFEANGQAGGNGFRFGGNAEGSANTDEAKQRAQQAANEFGQQRSVNGQASANQNAGAAGLSAQ